MRKYLLLLFISISFISQMGCTRKADEASLVTLSLPASNMSSKLDAFTHTPDSHMSQSVGAYSASGDGPQWNVALNPSTIADVNCYLIAVAGPEPDMRRNTCTTASGQSLYIGRWTGAIPAGGQVAIEVPSGSQRQILVFGLKANSGACRNFRIGEPDAANLSEPHLIGSATQDLSPGDVSVNITTSLSANPTKLDDCTGPDFQFGEGGPGLYFGDAQASVAVPGATSPNVVVSAGDVSTSSTLFPNPKTRGGYAKLDKIVPVANGVGIQVSAPSGSIQLGDEVMVLVMGSKGTNLGPSTNDYSACGFKSWPGQYGFARVISGSGAYSGGYTVNYDYVISHGSILSEAWKNANNNSAEFEFYGTANDDVDVFNNRLTQLATASDFCNIQIVKVQHMYNLSINSTREIYAPPFTWTGGGGVLAIRVNGTLTMESDSSLNVNGASWTGGYPSIATQKGDGILGADACGGTPQANNANGGGCGDGTNVAGAGGGHGNVIPPAMGSSSASTSQGGAQGGTSTGEDCGGSCIGSLNNKLFMGGAGGASAGAGGKGGGIVYVMARNVAVTCTSCIAAPSLSAKGENTSNMAGPGAGGSVLFGYINATNMGEVQIKVSGGTRGADVSLDPSPGAGGRIMVKKCTTSPAFLTANAIVSAGANYGAVAASQAGTKIIQDYVCN